MTRDQRRALRKQARFERSRRQPAPLFRLTPRDQQLITSIRDDLDQIVDVPHDDQPMPSRLADTLGQFMRTVGCQLPVLALDRAEIVKDAEVCSAEQGRSRQAQRPIGRSAKKTQAVTRAGTQAVPSPVE